MDKKQVKKIADVEANKVVKGHESRMHGKRMAKGGVTSESAMKLGRNMARAKNQTGG
ncbi:hypothetical protein UFOVP393_17 [uncultured Caudovirales phage]|jgi:hypothetical protein|uniref:Uncharacterized protein n=1 Tax=uncultured Caudovirales phage TaxID=2100421 RepID=A0A6J7X955_9CAUD|nr:hypothetical protein UFOVP393_17 [uncultured Caudovirales phage]